MSQKQRKFLKLIKENKSKEIIFKECSMSIKGFYKIIRRLKAKGYLLKVKNNEWIVTEKGNLFISDDIIKKDIETKLSDDDVRLYGMKLILANQMRMEKSIERLYSFLQYTKKINKQRPRLISSIRKRILKRDNFKCQNCSSSYNLHIDHIIPRSKGGTDEDSNLQVLCSKCNLFKREDLFNSFKQV
jgi:predicted transcriptional regulator